MPRGVAPRCPREGEGREGQPERGGAPASRSMKLRLQFSKSEAQPRVDGMSNTDRVDGVSDTVHPLGTWQPSDPTWTV